MGKITLTINDNQVKGEEGDTVLEICRANGIDVPTLCHLDGLSDVGACRIPVTTGTRQYEPVRCPSTAPSAPQSARSTG